MGRNDLAAHALTERVVQMIPVTVIRDVPVDFPTEVVGRFFAPDDKAVVSGPLFTEDEDSDRAAFFADDVESKVVKPRGRRPKAPTEGVETK